MHEDKRITSVFNIVEIQDEIDYKKLYEKEKKTRLFYQKKAKELQVVIKKIQKNDKSKVNFKKQQYGDIIETIKSFKSRLPTSVKCIDFTFSENEDEQKNQLKLMSQFAIYGATESDINQRKDNEKLQGNTLYSNIDSSQIVKHTSKLVFPSGVEVKQYFGRKANQKCLQIINHSTDKLKSFIISFQPQDFSAKQQTPQKSVIIDIVNPERRIYAVCLSLQDFTIIQNRNRMKQAKENNQSSSKQLRLPLSKNISFDDDKEDFTIAVTKRVYCYFTYYPFFNFIEEMLKKIICHAKIDRYIKFKQKGQNLQIIDSKFNGFLVNNMLKQFQRIANDKDIVLNKLIDFNFGSNSKLYLELNDQNCGQYLSSEWAFPILSLFTLDIFLDLFTLLVLQEKIIFVCSNLTVLTYTIFLFTKVLIRPYEYPYPVVSVLPDQQDYLNAPFPFVYGFFKSKSQTLESKIHKKFKNVFVFLEPQGLSIISEDNKKKILMKKSPKLRDRLLQKFKKMHKNFPKPSVSLFNFKENSNQFEFKNDITLASQMIREVHDFMLNDIHRHLPGQKQIQQIKLMIERTQNLDEEDLNQRTFLKVKQLCAPRSKDPFFQAFLQTQLLNGYIFQY